MADPDSGGTIRVLLADDHAILRDGLRILVDGEPDLEVVGEVDRADAVVGAARDGRADVVVLDLSMPGDGLTAIPRIRASGLATRVLVLTMHEEPGPLRSALKAGAAGYVAKRVAASQLLDAIRAVHAGRSYISASLDPEALREVLAPEPRPTDRSYDNLSVREAEVLWLIARGHTNREAAGKLHLSIKTVEGYRARVMRKLGAKTRVDLVAQARRLGLLD